MKKQLTRKSNIRSYLMIIISSVGASLTTAVAITDHNDPAWGIETILLAGVTAASLGLSALATSDNEEQE